MISDLDIIDACGRISEALTPPSNDWVVFFETAEITGAPSYTYRTGVSYCETAEIAVRHAMKHMPRFIDPETTRIRMVTAVRKDYVTDFDGYRFQLTPQFQMTEC